MGGLESGLSTKPRLGVRLAGTLCGRPKDFYGSKRRRIKEQAAARMEHKGEMASTQGGGNWRRRRRCRCAVGLGWGGREAREGQVERGRMFFHVVFFFGLAGGSELGLDCNGLRYGVKSTVVHPIHVPSASASLAVVPPDRQTRLDLT